MITRPSVGRPAPICFNPRVRCRPALAVAGPLLALALPAGAQVPDRTARLSRAQLSAPAAGQAVTDPTFGVEIRRLTNRGQMGGLATAEYPQLQAFNADETRILLSTDVDLRVMQVGTWQVTHTGLEGALPRWSPTDPDQLLMLNQRSGSPIILQEIRLMAGGRTSSRNLVNLSQLGFTAVDQGAWEELSNDGRLWAVVGERMGQDVVAVLDLSTGQLAAVIRAANVDWAAVSPSGRYVAVQYARRGTGPTDGLAIHDARSGQLLGHASDHHEHGDLGVDEQGGDVFATMAYTDFCMSGAVPCFSVAPLPDALEAETRLDHFAMTPGVGSYTSCRAVQRGGFCVHGDDLGSNPGSAPMAGELWLSRMRDGAVLRLAHHRSSSCDYYNTTRPSLSPRGSYAVFTSDWARPNCQGEADLYLVDLRGFIGGFVGGGGPRPDAGTMPTPDAGFPPVDAGFAMDAGRPPPADAGGGPPIDAGPVPTPDAGVAPVPDAGSSTTTPPGGGGSGGGSGSTRRSTSGGCGCATTPSGAPSTALAGLLVLALGLVRRRAR